MAKHEQVIHRSVLVLALFQPIGCDDREEPSEAAGVDDDTEEGDDASGTTTMAGDESSTGDTEPSVPAVAEPLSADMPHYDTTYDDLATEWMQYVNHYAPPACLDPLVDTNGEACAIGQDMASPVFFLAGTLAGDVTRDCTIPADKALFFPLVNAWGDNSLAPTGLEAPLDVIESYVSNSFATAPTDRMYLTVDDREYGNLQQGAVPPRQYVLDVPDGDNFLTCEGAPDGEASFVGYVAGYWALLPSLPPGEHALSFGLSPDPDRPDAFAFDVNYTLTVE